MSFIGKAAKKIFNFGKKIVKGVGRAFKNKWFRSAFIVALSVFAVGLGSGGFQGFNQAMTTATANGASTIGSFFSAVGSTMATGFGTITSSVSNFFGQAPQGTGLAGQPFSGTITTPQVTVAAPLSSAVTPGGSGTALLNAAGLGVGGAALPSSALGAGVTSALTTTTIAGTQTLAQRAMSLLTSNSFAGTFTRNAVLGGIQMWGKQKEADHEKRVNKRLNFYGGRARGGSAEVPEGLIRSPFAQSTPESSTARQIAVDPSNPITDSRKFRPSTGGGRAPLLSRATDITRAPSGGILDPRQQVPQGA